MTVKGQADTILPDRDIIADLIARDYLRVMQAPSDSLYGRWCSWLTLPLTENDFLDSLRLLQLQNLATGGFTINDKSDTLRLPTDLLLPRITILDAERGFEHEHNPVIFRVLAENHDSSNFWIAGMRKTSSGNLILTGIAFTIHDKLDGGLRNCLDRYECNNEIWRLYVRRFRIEKDSRAVPLEDRFAFDLVNQHGVVQYATGPTSHKEIIHEYSLNSPYPGILGYSGWKLRVWGMPLDK
jgi:hypothetical protein